MTVTFSKDVPESERTVLAWLAVRSFEVGIPCRTLRTCKPGTSPEPCGTIALENQVTYRMERTEGDWYISVEST